MATRPMPAYGLWRHPEFVKLWVGGAISQLGDSVTALALTLTAVTALGATPVQMGVLGAATSAPNLLLGLFAGVWVDRLRRRPIMVLSQLGQAAALGLIPAAALLDVLRMEGLYVVAFVVGSLSVFSDAASFSVVPSLVGRTRVVEANAAIALHSSVASIVGPGLASWLVQRMTAPLAILAGAISFVAAAICWGLLRLQEPPTCGCRRRSDMRTEIEEAVRAVYGDPVLRASTITSILGLLALSIQQPVLVLYLTRDLHLDPALIGIVFAAGGVASVVGAAVAGVSARNLGAGPAIALGNLLTALGMLLTPLAIGPFWLLFALLMLAQGSIGVGGPIYTTNQISLRQLVTPDHLLGRVHATRRFLVFGLAPLGALLGGALGGWLGPRPTLLVGGVCMFAALGWLMRSPVWSQRGPEEAAGG